MQNLNVLLTWCKSIFLTTFKPELSALLILIIGRQPFGNVASGMITESEGRDAHLKNFIKLENKSIILKILCTHGHGVSFMAHVTMLLVNWKIKSHKFQNFFRKMFWCLYYLMLTLMNAGYNLFFLVNKASAEMTMDVTLDSVDLEVISIELQKKV